MKALILILLVVGVTIFVLVVMQKRIPLQSDTPSPWQQSTQIPEVQSARAVADKIVLALRNKDMETVSEKSAENVRFSPYIYINTKEHKALSPEVIKNFFLISAAYTWGTFDGSGEPIVMGPGEYFEKFIFDHDYTRDVSVVENEFKQRGNMINNVKEIYPQAYVVEYHFSGTTTMENMDWDSLILVLENRNGEWKLIGIVHDQWTI